MKDILIIHPDLSGGGAEKVLINILNNIDYTKYNVTLLLIYKRGVYLENINKNVKVKSIYDYNKFKLQIFQSIYARLVSFLYNRYPNILLKYFNKNSNDVEIAFLEGEATKLLTYSNNKNSKKIAWIHSDLKEYSCEKLSVNKKYYNYIDKVVCVSGETRKSFNEVYPQYKDKSLVIYNLIDREGIKKNSEKIINYTIELPIIVAIGRLVKSKGFDVLIKAHKLLIDDGIENKLIIIGEGEEEERLRNLAKDLNVENTVDLLGFVKNPYPYIKKSKVFAISSIFEGFSLVAAEALILGKPIVATQCAGLIELLEYGKYGQLVDCNNSVQLKESLKNIIISKELYEYYKNLSLKRSEIFNSHKVINEIYQLL